MQQVYALKSCVAVGIKASSRTLLLAHGIIFTESRTLQQRQHLSPAKDCCCAHLWSWTRKSVPVCMVFQYQKNLCELCCWVAASQRYFKLGDERRTVFHIVHWTNPESTAILSNQPQVVAKICACGVSQKATFTVCTDTDVDQVRASLSVFFHRCTSCDHMNVEVGRTRLQECLYKGQCNKTLPSHTPVLQGAIKDQSKQFMVLLIRGLKAPHDPPVLSTLPCSPDAHRTPHENAQ